MLRRGFLIAVLVFDFVHSNDSAFAYELCSTSDGSLYSCSDGYYCGGDQVLCRAYCAYSDKSCGTGCIPDAADCCADIAYCDAGYQCSPDAQRCELRDQAPEVQIETPANGSRVKRKLKVRGYALDDRGLADLRYSLVGITSDFVSFKKFSKYYGSRGVSWAVTLKIPRRAKGEILFEVYAVDTAGNYSPVIGRSYIAR